MGRSFTLFAQKSAVRNALVAHIAKNAAATAHLNKINEEKALLKVKSAFFDKIRISANTNTKTAKGTSK